MSEFLNSFKTIDTLFSYIRGHCAEEILEDSAGQLGMEAAALAGYPMGGYSRGGTSGAYYFTIADMKENVDSYLWLHTRLADEESRRVLLELCRYRLCPMPRYLNSAYDGEHPQYFDSSVITCSPDEVFVDCGGFTGDTAEVFIRLYRSYGKIYIFEPSPENAARCRQSMEPYRDVHVIQAGVGRDRADKLCFSRESSASSIMHQGGKGADEIDILSLDTAIKEPVDFIKMDIEGSELDAIEGARRHITEENPKLAVCLYHMVTDLWEIPRLIDAMNPEYRFYLRHYEKDLPWETVLYAVPKTAGAGKEDGRKEARAGSGGCFAGILKPGDCAYVREHAEELDLAFLAGADARYSAPLALYRELRPNGIVCLQLSGDAAALEQIPADTAGYRCLFDRCDVILAASGEQQKWLCRKWRRRIDYLPPQVIEAGGLLERLRLLAALNEG